MQLLIEQWASPHLNEGEGEAQSLVEVKQDKGKALYIEGIFMQAEVTNRNGRKYPKRVLASAVDKYIKEQVSTKQALGELNHPSRPNVDPQHAAIIIEKLWWDGNNVMGRARIIEGDGGAGDKTASLIRAGWIPGVSSRGLGVVKEVNGINEVQDGFRLTVGVDVVWGPSAPAAYVNPVEEQGPIGISESKENDANYAFTKLTECLENSYK